eukprot:352473-Chlamydomonas_euryale.AAC.6
MGRRTQKRTALVPTNVVVYRSLVLARKCCLELTPPCVHHRRSQHTNAHQHIAGDGVRSDGSLVSRSRSLRDK